MFQTSDVTRSRVTVTYTTCESTEDIIREIRGEYFAVNQPADTITIVSTRRVTFSNRSQVAELTRRA